MRLSRLDQVRRLLSLKIPLPSWLPSNAAAKRFLDAFLGPFMIACGLAQFIFGLLFLRLAYQFRSNLGLAMGVNTFILLLIETFGMSLFFVVLGVSAVRKYRETRRRLTNQLCLNCGYDLRATPDCCPECGYVPSPIKKGDDLPSRSV